MTEFDVFVIGSGIAGQTVAESCVKSGKTVAITDNRAYGGTCANRGCDPKKVILGFTEILQRSKQLLQKGITNIPEVNWHQIKDFKNSFTNPVSENTVEKLKDLGVKLFYESPQFIDKSTLQVGEEKIKAKHIVIATGLKPRSLEIKGAEHTLVSDDFLALNKLPKRMLFIGAGYIGMEFAHIAARLGVEVTILQSGDRPLKNFDSDMVQQLVKATNHLGVKLIVNAEVTAIEKYENQKKVYYQTEGNKKEIITDVVFNTTGRVPAIDLLDLYRGSVAFTDKGVSVNEHLQSITNPRVYACGDVAERGAPLTPFSGREGSIVAHNILNGNQQKAIFPVFPSITFTLPNLAKLGLLEEEARAQYTNISVNYNDASTFFNAKRINESIYAYKTIVNTANDQILGVHLIGPQAAEVINVFAVVVHQKMTTTALKDILFAYPTWGSDVTYMF
ncbi:dihydrolipoyl dehydrogenase family protein [Aquimarina brevivitae]|uniref:Glutathione reductase (NADPH) n=1 Tax=Aquimarina brevivitae TaxID=323412 RepID=A0A4Q7PFU8_9FLAO|nr:NAD(P)/FAD-dependent oxidoreductase [Aquimarina brevivitae]RZS99057.1 glutathione reductase (NADPH) [Aquimarina brevivitae]